MAFIPCLSTPDLGRVMGLRLPASELGPEGWRLSAIIFMTRLCLVPKEDLGRQHWVCYGLPCATQIHFPICVWGTKFS